MSGTAVVENTGAVAHRYEHRATRETYVWPAGEAREVPEEVALTVTAAHPRKMRIREAGTRGEKAQAPPPERVSDEPAETVRGEPVEPQPGLSERPHLHRWNRRDTCRCGLRRQDHRRHSHHWRLDGTCRCGKRHDEVRLR